MDCSDPCVAVRNPVSCPRVTDAYTINRCFDQAYGPSVTLAAPGSPVSAVIRPQSASFQANLLDPNFRSNLSNVISQVQAHQPRELFPGAVLLAGLVTSIGIGFAGAPAGLTSLLSGARSLAEQGGNVALNLGGILQGVGGLASSFGQIPGFGALGSLGQITTSLAPIASAFAPQQVPTAAVYAPASFGTYGIQAQPPMQNPMVIQTGALSTQAASAAMRLIAPILVKIAQKLGLRSIPTLRRAVSLIRKGAKIILSPEALAIALGITLDEMARLIVTDRARPRRRMNPANTRALRRSLRRLCSFERLSDRVHSSLGGRGGSTKRRSRGVSRLCRNCKANPCRC